MLTMTLVTKLKPLLTFIGNIEAPDGYNQQQGELEASVYLVDMTVSEILDLQRQRIKDPNKESSAVGRYQIIYKTMKDLSRTLNLRGDELFTETLQDTLAICLMKRRGLNKWMDGQSSSEKFANSLAKEWASLPVVTGVKKGQSYYSKVGSNKSLVSPEEVLNAMNKVKES